MAGSPNLTEHDVARHVVSSRRWVLLEGALAGCVWMASLIVVSPVIGWVIDSLLAGGKGAWPVVTLAVVALVQAGATAHRHLVASRIFSGVRQTLQCFVLRAFDGADVDVQERIRPHLVSMAVNDSTRIAIAFDNWCRGSASVLGIAACLLLAFRTSTPFGWILVTTCAVLLVVNATAIWFGRDVLLREQETSQEVLGATVRAVNHLASVPADGRVYNIESYRAKLQGGVRAARSAVALTGVTRCLTTGALALTVVLSVVVLRGSASAGTIATAIGYALLLQTPVLAVCEFAFSTSRAYITMRRLALAVSGATTESRV